MSTDKAQRQQAATKARSSVLKNSLIYVVASLGNKAIPFLLLPIITRYLPPEQYGLYAIYQVFISFLTPFIGMSLEIHISRNYFRVEREELRRIVSSIVLILHLNVVVGLLLLFAASFVVDQPFGLSRDVLLVLPIIIYAQLINAFELGLLRYEERPIRFGLMQLSMSALNLGVGLGLLMMLHYGWKSLVLGLLVGQLAVAGFSLWSIRRRGLLQKNLAPLWPILRISLPLILHLLGGSIIFLSDRLFIEKMLGLKVVGVYSVGVQFGNIAMLVFNSVMLAFGPWFFKKLAAADKGVVRRSYQLMLGFLLMGIAVWAVSYIALPIVVAKEYDTARVVIFWVVLGFVLRGWYQIFYNVILHEGKTKIFPFITGGAALLNLVLNYVLILHNGMVGAAQATVVAFALMFALTWFFTQKYSPLAWLGTRPSRTVKTE